MSRLTERESRQEIERERLRSLGWWECDECQGMFPPDEDYACMILGKKYCEMCNPNESRPEDYESEEE